MRKTRAQQSWVKDATQKQANIKKLTRNVNLHYHPTIQTEDSTRVVHPDISPWEFGARVTYLNDQAEEIQEFLCFPPVIGRFSVSDYNRIVKQINLSVNGIVSSTHDQ